MERKDYKRLGDFIRTVDIRNTDLQVTNLVGLTIAKAFIPSVANTIGTDLSKYKVIKENQFACSLMQVSRDGKMPIAIYKGENAIMSPAYPMFEVCSDELLPDYLQMWFAREEFDREATFYAVGGVRGSLDWDDFMDMRLPVPPISEQQKIVSQYQAIEHRIAVNNGIIQKLEDAAQAIYRKMFVEDIDSENLPEGWKKGKLSDVATIIMGQSPSGDSYNFNGDGTIFYQGRSDFGFRYPSVRMFTTEPKKLAEKNSVLMSVRAPVGDINLANNNCCIGRGLASIKSKKSQDSYLYYLMKSLYPELAKYNEEGEGTVFGSINGNALNDFAIIVAPEEVTNNFNDKAQKIDTYIKHLSKENDNLTSLLKTF